MAPSNQPYTEGDITWNPFAYWGDEEESVATATETALDSALEFAQTGLVMPQADVIPLAGYDQTMPLADPDDELLATPVEEPFPTPLHAAADIFTSTIRSIRDPVGTFQDIMSSLSQGFASFWSGLTGAPMEEDWEHTSDYMAGSDDPRWQALHDIPPVELAYQLAHPGGYTPTSGGNDMVTGQAGAPWGDYQEGDFGRAISPFRTDPNTGQQRLAGFNPQSHGGAIILRRWTAGPRGGPRIQFTHFQVGNRKYIGCIKADGTWKQWPVYRPLVVGKTMTDRKARKVASRLETYAKTSRKILGMLGYSVSRKTSKR